MLKNNSVTGKQRLKELAIDYVCILMYLLLLFGVVMGVFHFVLDGIPVFNEMQSQLVAVFTSVVPIILIFSYWDYHKGSIGKRKAGLRVAYGSKNFGASLIRNIIKFLPWELAHIGVIHGIYTGFDIWAITLTYLSIGTGILLFVMGMVRKDKRHLGDLVAGTQVQVIQILKSD
jgi:uncharacterized RDD family membrane protein YckC